MHVGDQNGGPLFERIDRGMRVLPLSGPLTPRNCYKRNGYRDACVACVRLKENQGENMQNEDDLPTRDQLDQHSLPGTNQAGTGPGSSQKEDRTGS